MTIKRGCRNNCSFWSLGTSLEHFYHSEINLVTLNSIIRVRWLKAALTNQTSYLNWPIKSPQNLADPKSCFKIVPGSVKYTKYTNQLLGIKQYSQTALLGMKRIIWTGLKSVKTFQLSNRRIQSSYQTMTGWVLNAFPTALSSRMAWFYLVRVHCVTKSWIRTPHKVIWMKMSVLTCLLSDWEFGASKRAHCVHSLWFCD